MRETDRKRAVDVVGGKDGGGKREVSGGYAIRLDSRRAV